MRILTKFSCALLLGVMILSSAEIQPPGERPVSIGAHALVGGRTIIKPGVLIQNGTIIIRNGRIRSVFETGKSPIPPDCRVWPMDGKTIYAGFIEPYLSLGDDKANPVSNRWTVPIDARSSINFKGVPTTKGDMGDIGPGYGIEEIRPQYKVSDTFSPNEKEFSALRELGYTAGNLIPTSGIIRGSSTSVLLGQGDPNDLMLNPSTLQHMAFSPAKNYPKSLMGVIAAIRQTVFDTIHYQKMRTWTMQNQGLSRMKYNPALAAMENVIAPDNKQQVAVETGSVLMIARTAKLSEELGFEPIIVATGQEWRRPEILKKHAFDYILPVAFPAAPDLPDEMDWNMVSLDQLRTWDWAPEIPVLLSKNNRDFSFTIHGLTSLKSFRKNVQKSIERGLTEKTALTALTTHPAKLLGMSSLLGTIERGKLANLTIVDGESWFNPENQISGVWIEGRYFPSHSAPTKTEKDAKQKKVKLGAVTAKTPSNYRGVLKNPTNVIIRNATIWTSGKTGILSNANMHIKNGRITAIGPISSLPDSPDTFVIDAKGRHVTPGLIDCHSHSMILGGVNEGTLPSTAMVRIGDVVNSETENIYRQLAGGLTMANLLHGSANPIGGQNAVIKLRFGELPDDMIFKKAPAGIKFALGENVKQSNWGDDRKTRFPQTRMGVKTFFNNRFIKSRQYLEKRNNPQMGNNEPQRRDLELEAIGEIIEGKRLIHCHSYRQDEMLIFLRTMERFGVRVGTLQHVLEGYKIADEIASHGAGASSFSDWWAYKFEVYDAIPYNGSLLHERGVSVSFNSDSSDLARRMNLEAAKAVKYGAVSEEEALKFVTINPAKQLRIDKWVGSLEIGKDADFVIWNGHPLNTQTLCDETWIEGKQYYDRSKSAARAKAMADERKMLLTKLRSNGKGEKTELSARALFFRQALEKAHLLNNCYECKKGKP